MDDRKAIFCVDPGGSSGLAWAVVDTSWGTVAEAMRNRQHNGSATVQGRDEMIHVKRIVDCFQYWTNGIENEITHIDLCIEDWNPLGKRSKEGSSPARIGWGLVGWLMGLGWDPDMNVEWIQPDAQRFATQARLRPMDAWVVGKEHERSAHALMVARLHKLMGS